MDEVVCKSIICYQKMKHKGDNPKKWSNKKGQNFAHNGKGGKLGVHRNSPRSQVNKNLGKYIQKNKVLGELKNIETVRKS